jgi:hypothetical protein
MKLFRYRHPLVLLAATALAACSGSDRLDIGEANRLIEGKAFTKTTESRCLALQARLLPGEYLDLRAGSQGPESAIGKQSARSMYRFQVRVRIEAAEACIGAEGAEDLIYSRGPDVPAVSESFHRGIRERAWILKGDKRLRPVSTILEDSHGIDPGRTFLLLFEAESADWDKDAGPSLILERLLPELGMVRFDWSDKVWKTFNS